MPASHFSNVQKSESIRENVTIVTIVTMIVELILFVAVAALAWHLLTRLPETYPATPPVRLPFIGHGLYMLGYRNTQEAFESLCSKYGRDGMMVQFHF
jgi:hypothetical protein